MLNIRAVSYGESRSDLAPYLRSLLPAPVVSTTPPSVVSPSVDSPATIAAANPVDPTEVRGVYGRFEEIKELSGLIESTPLVAVYGLTGIGKTTLIHEVRRGTKVARRRSISFRASAQMTLTQLYQQAAVVLGDDSEDPKRRQADRLETSCSYLESAK